MTFIKLSSTGGNVRYSFNVNHIQIYYRDHDNTIIIMDGNWDNHWRVNETPDEIDQLIKEIDNGA